VRIPEPVNDRDLYDRGVATLLTSWEVYARSSRGAAVIRLPGAAAAVFPDEPERRIYNNAVLERELASADRAYAVAAVEETYAKADVGRFAVWAHETDVATRADLERRGYRIDESTRAMGMSLNDVRVPRPEIELGPADWDEHRRTLGLPSGLLEGVDRSVVHVLVACIHGENVATAVAVDHEGDCGIYNVGTLEHARRRGLATALIALHVHEALARGCRTASVQSTPMAESVYAAVGFRDLGRILEHSPERVSPRASPRGFNQDRPCFNQRSPLGDQESARGSGEARQSEFGELAARTRARPC
jgi:GNAT superfamily N-acetyltransferase